MTAQPKVGDRVRVVVEGEMSVDNRGVGDFPGHLWIGEQGRRSGIASAHVASVEILPPPEPEWWPPKPGDVVRVGEHAVWMRGNYHWTTPLNVGTVMDADIRASHDAHRDITLLVRDGKPVTSP